MIDQLQQRFQIIPLVMLTVVMTAVFVVAFVVWEACTIPSNHESKDDNGVRNSYPARSALVTYDLDSGIPESFEPPALLTQDQIDAMDEQETREMIMSISDARSYYSKQLDDEMEDVYKEQFLLVLSHLKVVRGQ